MTIEVTAKKIEDAINQGLAQLGTTIDKVDVEVLEQGGVFRKAKVRLTLADEAEEKTEKIEKPVKTEKAAEEKVEPKKTEKIEKTEKAEKSVKQEKPTNNAAEKPAKPVQPKKPQGEGPKQSSEKKEVKEPRARTEEDKAAFARAVEFVREVISKMGFEGAEITADEKAEVVSISAPAGDDSLIIGRHGETLSALSYIAETCARAEKCHINVTVDCNGYRDRRAQSLTAMAKRRADECVNKHRRIKLEPMERVDRRTIHNALTGDDRVTTASEGKEPYRYIVIAPKK
ncbi:MAG: KH domain-containing protein [Clostridiales bacterium]|nr:KH domain-containing protein [Clostridiales bacterium]